MNTSVAVREDGVKLCWDYKMEGRAVASLGAVPVEVNYGAGKINAAWAVDFSTLPEYRRRGIGTALVNEANKKFELFLAVGATEMSFALFTRMGWKYAGAIPHYLKVFDLKALIQKRPKNKFTAMSLLPLAVTLALLNFFTRPRAIKGITIESINSFGREADLFWEGIAPAFGIAVPRNSRYLSRKYDAANNTHYVKLRALRNGILCGYGVLRCIEAKVGKPEGLITEIIASPHDKDAVRALLYEAISYLKAQDCSSVRCYFTDKRIGRMLLRHGFMRRSSTMRFLLKKNIEGRDGVYRMDNWYLSAGDSDIDR